MYCCDCEPVDGTNARLLVSEKEDGADEAESKEEFRDSGGGDAFGDANAVGWSSTMSAWCVSDGGEGGGVLGMDGMKL